MITFDKGNYWQLPEVMQLYKTVIQDMEQKGLEQWKWGVYPNTSIIGDDLSNGRTFLLFDDSTLVGAFVLNDEQSPEYKAVAWMYGTKPIVMHRFVLLPSYQGKGLGKDVVDLMESIGQNSGYDSIRLDTYSKNTAALALYQKCGFRKSGEVHFEEKQEPFVCFEKPLIPDCPLLPIPMVPAYRHGAMTPWGGNRLKEIYGKNTPDNQTGESLEVSVIECLVSHSLQGEGLDQLIKTHGEKLQGKAITGVFPLLLKLLDAKSALSVQVHPNDAYAAKHENGKLGKTEAWLILDAKPGAQLVYGVKEGTSKQALLEASQQGKAVESLLRQVPVSSGDICFIPAGCVHAIGEGIVLYEIQQSSDVTYRFYDWDRTDDEGNKRELHIEKAVDVTDVNCQLSPISLKSVAKEGVSTLLENPCFTMEGLKVKNTLTLTPDEERFRIITALDAITLGTIESTLELKKGDTVLIPASSPAITLKGEGLLILSKPTLIRK